MSKAVCIVVVIILFPALLCLSSCNKPRSIVGVDPAVKLLLDMEYGDYCSSFLHPAGGFLVCREGIRGWGSVARLSDDGTEQWRCDVGSMNGLEIVRVDDNGRIYVYSEDRVLDVISPDGSVLWSRGELSREMTTDQVAANGKSIMVQTMDSLLLLNENGEDEFRLGYSDPGQYGLEGYFYRTDDDRMRILVGWHFTGDPPDPASCGVQYELLGEAGRKLWQHTAGGIDPGSSAIDNAGLADRHAVGRLRIMPDGRNFLLREDTLFEFDDEGSTRVIETGLESPEILWSMLNDASELTPAGNYMFCDNNSRISENDGLTVLEFTPELELVHQMNYTHTLIDGDEGGASAPHPLRKGRGFYDMHTELVYLYFERDYGGRDGSIFLLDKDGTLLEEWLAGTGSIIGFFRRGDGRIVARRNGGDLLLLPAADA